MEYFEIANCQITIVTKNRQTRFKDVTVAVIGFEGI